MSRLITTLKLSLIILFSFLFHKPIASAAGAATNLRVFLDRSCNVTIHKSVCVKSLSPYLWYIANHQTTRQMAKLALAVSLKNTKETRRLVTQNLNSLVTAPNKNNNDSYKYLKDCAEQMGSSVDSLTGSIHELRNSGSNRSEDYMMHMSNVQTWVSAALTNTYDCKDSMSDLKIGPMRSYIKKRAAYAGELISNALAFCNKLVPSY